MAITFPSSPSVGQTYSVSGNTWSWDGVSWNLVRIPAGPTGPTGPTGLTGPTGATGPIAIDTNMIIMQAL